jgi:hypothetical protein
MKHQGGLTSGMSDMPNNTSAPAPFQLNNTPLGRLKFIGGGVAIGALVPVAASSALLYDLWPGGLKSFAIASGATAVLGGALAACMRHDMLNERKKSWVETIENRTSPQGAPTP